MDAQAGFLWHKTAGESIPRNSPRHRGGPVCLSVGEAVSLTFFSAGSVLSVWTTVESVLTNDGQKKGQHAKMQVGSFYFTEIKHSGPKLKSFRRKIFHPGPSCRYMKQIFMLIPKNILFLAKNVPVFTRFSFSM